ncbi:hypothetical protein EMIHUDRAFT_68376 [Emiliania huxleyi CCMP1516]|uniref:Cation/H+ exchanger transmembrane domain-containing protein n=2 Tax=Emiliania huxleyi TaxID=2903 RepID=A0A0D3I9N5_EMIH1|nr:hypothetical protein EMIHUDRAFT_68376 [Emiliania huxleyi CCMP1516]EOD07970.1 hypothetical protein EMIHUDRAFT_68376 [Emiliania huxleyi CCMP1516]|eukprot:XP_005760399.1 hypothetical protein EMIHUDRAFT_68376 [Emiliania huxleyi CCMP1516]
MEYRTLVIFSGLIFAYSNVSGALASHPVNGALVFVVVGVCLGPVVLGWLDFSIGDEAVREGLSLVAEVTLALVLFSDAASANLLVLRHSYRLPVRLLLVGLPLTIILGAGVGYLLFGDTLSPLEVFVLATMLAPTDAALGKAVVTDSRVPSYIREALNLESGLNDGICVPVLFIFLALVSPEREEHGRPADLALRLTAEAIGIGAVVAVAITGPAVWLFERCESRQWVGESWEEAAVPSLAVACFASAQWFGGSGFISCFIGGLLFGRLIPLPEHKARLLEAAESAGDVLALVTWVLFGAVLIDDSMAEVTSWQVVAYALLSLTVVRILPVVVALSGTRLKTNEKIFIGWFGPRGLASVVFTILVMDERDLPGGKTIVVAVACSVLLHGMSANPLVAALEASLRDKHQRGVAGAKTDAGPVASPEARPRPYSYSLQDARLSSGKSSMR